MKERSRALAVRLDARLPTGDEQNLLGSGTAGLRGFGAFSTAIGAFAPHVNLSYQWNGRSVLGGDVRNGEKGKYDRPVPLGGRAATSASTPA